MAEKLITVDPNVLVGKPVIRGTRIPVHLVLNLLAHSYDFARIIEAYPVLNEAQIRLGAATICEQNGREVNQPPPNQ